ncbi:uncharacterized protein [Lepeophtheirus salmonis]|uniref:Signal peptidase complex catalytic subunit SEC11 n=1 Tax=Lepeophtheirus salmonis TaxID=72036 RepID=A0A0K2UDF1_LEPSM|nr:signal peptidase complex catalytic subunit SEC11-like [Lepeophtheirus salmonis]
MNRGVLLEISLLCLSLSCIYLYASRYGYPKIGVVRSGSMEPNYLIGDLIFIQEAISIESGDVIVFKEDSTFIAHRVVKLDRGGVTTKGDANIHVDKHNCMMKKNCSPYTLPLGHVVGKVWKRIPRIGLFIIYLRRCLI